MKYDVIIIGSGLGGLECGSILSKAGKSVLVLEREQQPGGCMQSYRRRGLDFDTGLHYVGGLGEGQSLYAPFKNLGLLDLPWQRMDPEGFDQITIDDKTYCLAEGFDNFVETLARDFPDQREELKKYVALMQKAIKDETNIINPDGGNVPTENFSKSAWEFLKNTISNPTLRNVLSGSSVKLELRKESLPLFTYAHCNAGYIESAWRLKGSGNLIADKLISNIKVNGGDVICQAGVGQLIEKDGKIISALCDNGEEYEADIFVSDVHPTVTMRMIKDSKTIRPIFRMRMEQLENTFGMLTVQLHLKPHMLKYFNHNKFVYNGDVWDFYETERRVDGVMISCRIPEQGEYARQIDILTPAKWNFCEKWKDTTVGNRGKDYQLQKQRRAYQAVVLAEKVIPGLGGMIEDIYTTTPLTYRDYTCTPDGSAFGVRKDYRHPLQTMLTPQTPLSNLFLTGQSLVLHGLQGVTMSSLLTTACILGREKVWEYMKD